MRFPFVFLLLFLFNLSASEKPPELPRWRSRLPEISVRNRKFWSRNPGKKDFADLLKRAEAEKDFFPPALPENRPSNRLIYRNTLMELRRRFRMFCIASLLTGKRAYSQAAALHLRSLAPADWCPIPTVPLNFPPTEELETASELAAGTILLAPELPAGMAKKVAEELQKKIYTPWKKQLQTPKNVWPSSVHQYLLLTRIFLAMPPQQPADRELLWKKLWGSSAQSASRISRESFSGSPQRTRQLRDALLWLLLLKEACVSPPPDAPWEILQSAAFLPERLQLSVGKYPEFASFSIEPQLREEIDDLRCRLFGGPMRRRSRFRAGDETLGEVLDGLRLPELPRRNIPLSEYEEFRTAGLVIFRPAAAQAHKGLCGAFYGGTARHKDAGVFVLATGRNAPLLRSLPVCPGGEGQQYGPHSAVPMLLLHRTETKELTAVFDLAPAYRQLKNLLKLRRTFRVRPDSFLVTDSVEFSEPQSFETGVVTPGSVRKLSADTLLISAGEKALKNAVELRIQSSGGPFELLLSNIPGGTRIGIRTEQPILSAQFRLLFRQP